MADGMEAKIEVIEVQLSHIINGMEKEEHARKAQYQQNEKTAELLIRMDNRLEKVEAFVTEARPTINEYIAFRTQARGAGWAGRWLWILAMASISGAAWVWATWKAWTGH
jgi:hypothetical protein